MVWFYYFLTLKFLRMKIKIIQPVPDKDDPSVLYKVDQVIDLGAERNKAAVDSNLAVWVDEKGTEKPSIPSDKKKKVTKAGSEIIETKKAD